MKKCLELSLYSASVSAVAILLASSAFAGNYKGENYKGENYKGEAMPVAAPCPVEKALKDGFYVGAQVGYDSYRVPQSFNIATGYGSNSSAANGFAGGVFAGYGQYFSEGYYLAGEILANATSAQQTASGTTTIGSVSGSYNSKVSATAEYGVRILPGIKVNNSTLFYIPLGYNWARIKGQFSGSNSAGASFSTSKSNTSGGFVYGIGMETAVYENFSIRTEFNHTGYNSFSTQGVKFSPYDNQFMLGLSYHFA